MSKVVQDKHGQNIVVPTCQCKAGLAWDGKCGNLVDTPGGLCETPCSNCEQPELYPCACADTKNAKYLTGDYGCSHGFMVLHPGEICKYCSWDHKDKKLLVDAPINPIVGATKESFEAPISEPAKTTPYSYEDALLGMIKSKTKKAKPKKYDHKKMFEDATWADLPPYIKTLGFEQRLDLAQACADFYLLERMATDGKGYEYDWPGPDLTIMEMAEKRLQGLEDRLAKQMSLYLDMACGGEFRYASEGAGSYAGTITDPVTKDYLASVNGHSRRFAWEKWMRLRRNAPKKTLAQVDVMVEVFEGEWKGRGAGGEKWAQCARLLRQYLRGTMKPRHFVNMAFSLQHNNSLVFDKLWYVNTLNEVLVKQAEQDYDSGILPYASPDVQVLWEHYKKSRMRDWERRVDRA